MVNMRDRLQRTRYILLSLSDDELDIHWNKLCGIAKDNRLHVKRQIRGGAFGWWVKNAGETWMDKNLETAWQTWMRYQNPTLSHPPQFSIYCYNCGLEQPWCMDAKPVAVKDWSPTPYKGKPVITAGNTYFHGQPKRCERCNKQVMTCPQNAVCAFCDAYQDSEWWLQRRGQIKCKPRNAHAQDNHSADVYRLHVVDGDGEQKIYERPDRKNCECQTRPNFSLHGGIAGKAITIPKKNGETRDDIYGGFVMVH